MALQFKKMRTFPTKVNVVIDDGLGGLATDAFDAVFRVVNVDETGDAAFVRATLLSVSNLSIVGDDGHPVSLSPKETLEVVIGDPDYMRACVMAYFENSKKKRQKLETLLAQ